MRPLSQILCDLVVFAEEVVARPLLDSRFVGDRFTALDGEVRVADRRPAEGVRATSAAIIMVTAINEFRHASRDRAPGWLMLVGTALPLLRQEAFDAFSDEKERRER
jgi:hypothetical protein